MGERITLGNRQAGSSEGPVALTTDECSTDRDAPSPHNEYRDWYLILYPNPGHVYQMTHAECRLLRAPKRATNTAESSRESVCKTDGQKRSDVRLTSSSAGATVGYRSRVDRRYHFTFVHRGSAWRSVPSRGNRKRSRGVHPISISWRSTLLYGKELAPPRRSCC